MANPLFNSILNTLDAQSINSTAGAVGQPASTVAQCLKTCIASVFAGLAGKSGDPSALRRIMDLAPSGGEVSWSQMTGEASGAYSPLIATGKRTLSALFGNSEGDVNNAISRECNLQPGITAKLLTLAAPMVLGFLNRHMRSEGMSIIDLGRALQRETPAIRSALPAGLASLFWPTAGVTEEAPVVAQTVQRETARASSGWIPAAVALAALLAGFFWLFHHNTRQPTTANLSTPPAPATGMASRAVTPPATNTGLTAVNLHFNTGSSTLRPRSQQELRKVVSVLQANPNTKVTISGFTDNVGNADRNIALSQARANTVMADLTHSGISKDRMTVQGYGEQNPVADNGTTQGRAQNRRVEVAPQ